MYKFKREDIIYFTPTLEYMKASMKEKDVAEGTNFDNKQSSNHFRVTERIAESSNACVKGWRGLR